MGWVWIFSGTTQCLDCGGGQGGRNPGAIRAGSLRETGEERAGDGIPKGVGAEEIRPCYTRQFFLQLFVARQVARKISRVTPQFCNLQRQQNVALRVARKVEISCV